MISTGVRDLKNRLSHYLRIVQDGEQVLVTDHGRVVAELRLPEVGLRGKAVPFAAFADPDAIRWPTEHGDPLADWPRRAKHLPRGTAQQLIDEDRGD